MFTPMVLDVVRVGVYVRALAYNVGLGVASCAVVEGGKTRGRAWIGQWLALTAACNGRCGLDLG